MTYSIGSVLADTWQIGRQVEMPKKRDSGVTISDGVAMGVGSVHGTLK